ncbi:MAG: hypothetical protein FJ271_21515 [Planctomycetes bacterium]|nr:hypothetical protein [Planctomycetota bacterium]
MSGGSEEGGVNLGIIITPMLDMAFQLMAFFIMTYHPSSLEGHFDVKLLPPKDLATKGPADPAKADLPPLDTPPELQDVITVSIKAVKDGQTQGARAGGDADFVKLYIPPDIEGKTISLEEKENLTTEAERQDPLLASFEWTLKKKLTTELKQFLADGANSNANIKIEPDANLKHKYAMSAYDACKQAGFLNIQFVGPTRAR